MEQSDDLIYESAARYIIDYMTLLASYTHQCGRYF